MPSAFSFSQSSSYYGNKFIIIIIIIGTTAPLEPSPSSEASASCHYSLQHFSSFSPPTSWHLPSVMILTYIEGKTFHEPILRSLNHFAGLHISNSPAIASLVFATILFFGAGCQPCVQPPAILEDRLDCFLVWVFVSDQSGMGGPTSRYAAASIAP